MFAYKWVDGTSIMCIPRQREKRVWFKKQHKSSFFHDKFILINYGIFIMHPVKIFWSSTVLCAAMFCMLQITILWTCVDIARTINYI